MIWVQGCAALLALTLLGIKTGRVWLEAPAKAGASLCFLGLALQVGLTDRGAAGLALLIGLVLSAVGDVALISRDKRAFLLGLVAFLSLHVAYVVAFLALGVAPLGLVALLPVGAMAAVVWRWVGSRAGKLARPVAAYIAVISAMVVAASMALAHSPGTGRGVLFVAAVLFYLSDLCVARDRFVQRAFVNRLIGLPLYYAAQLLFPLGLVH